MEGNNTSSRPYPREIEAKIKKTLQVVIKEVFYSLFGLCCANCLPSNSSLWQQTAVIEKHKDLFLYNRVHELRVNRYTTIYRQVESPSEKQNAI